MFTCICILAVLGSNLGRNIAVITNFFSRLSSVLPSKFRDNASIWLQPLPSRSFLIQRSNLYNLYTDYFNMRRLCLTFVLFVKYMHVLFGTSVESVCLDVLPVCVCVCVCVCVRACVCVCVCVCVCTEPIIHTDTTRIQQDNQAINKPQVSIRRYNIKKKRFNNIKHQQFYNL
jgi:hypothetical protein